MVRRQRILARGLRRHSSEAIQILDRIRQKTANPRQGIKTPGGDPSSRVAETVRRQRILARGLRRAVAYTRLALVRHSQKTANPRQGIKTS